MEMCSGSVVSLFETILVDEIEQNHAMLLSSHTIVCIFAFMHLADAFIQSDLQLHSGYTFSLVCVFPGNRTHNLLCC